MASTRVANNCRVTGSDRPRTSVTVAVMARSNLAIIAVAIAVASMLLAAATAVAATRTKPVKDHSWQIDSDPIGTTQPRSQSAGQLTAHPAVSASAIPCTGCSPALILTCVGHGLLRLSLPVAAVANGREGASKQIRLKIDRTIDNRRAITTQTSRGFIPVLELPADDELIDNLQRGRLLELSFYGQRSYVGLTGASTAINTIRARCLPGEAPQTGGIASKQHCIWNIVISCSPDRATARDAASRIPGAFIRSGTKGHCAVLAIDDLALARNRAGQLGAPLERSCLP